MKLYFNTNTKPVETIYEIDSSDFKTKAEFRKESRRLLNEYWTSGHNVRLSMRSTKEWRER